VAVAESAEALTQEVLVTPLLCRHRKEIMVAQIVGHLLIRPVVAVVLGKSEKPRPGLSAVTAEMERLVPLVVLRPCMPVVVGAVGSKVMLAGLGGRAAAETEAAMESLVATGLMG